MYVQILNKVCFTICIMCIVLGTVLGLAMIWLNLHDSEFVWKSWLTILLFFLSSLLTLLVSKAFEGRGAREPLGAGSAPFAVTDRSREDRPRAP